MKVISAIIITKNEENTIGKCIDSVQGIADEIIVVDSYSTDKTREIAEERKVRFLEHPFKSYAQQKNWAADQARFPYILSIDADEIVDETLRTELLKIKAGTEYDAYAFNRLNNYCGKWLKHGGWYPDTKIRLWKSVKGRWVGDHVHETLRMDQGTSLKHLKGNLLHYSLNSIFQHQEKVNHFSELGAREAYEKGKRSGCLRILVIPAVRFIRDYFIKLGFLDGYYGFIACKISAHAKFLKYVKLRELQRNGR